MADSKKYNGSAWQHSLRKLGTSTDTITTLPVDVYADGNNATVGLKGNTVQNGTPTHDNPIMLQGTGDLETAGAKAGQYKIPISSANTTTPVYLGEVESTRKIKKLVLTGKENWILYALPGAVNVERFYIVLSQAAISGGDIIVSTHFPTEINNSDTEHIRCGGASSNEMYIYISRLVATTSAELKSYLAAQYAAGTPVIAWYVLANEKTGIVNEPLMKIGDYADTVSGITIPTITGKDTFDVDTTLKPSEVSLSYTGWHDTTVEEWDGSQWQ